MATSLIARSQVAGATLQAPPSPFLGVVPRDMLDSFKNPFFVNLTWLGIAPGAASVQQYTADPGRDFVAYLGNISIRAVADESKIADAPLTLAIADSGGRTLQQPGQGIDVANLLGTAQQPAVWTMPLVVRGGESMTFTLQNLHAATSYNVRIALLGFQSTKASR